MNLPFSKENNNNKNKNKQTNKQKTQQFFELKNSQLQEFITAASLRMQACTLNPPFVG